MTINFPVLRFPIATLGAVVLLAQPVGADEKDGLAEDANFNLPKVEFLGAYAVSDGGTLSATVRSKGKNITFCFTHSERGLPWAGHQFYSGAGHPTEPKARLVPINSAEEDRLLRLMEYALAPHMTLAAVQARKLAMAEIEKKIGFPPPPGGSGPHGVELGIFMLNRIQAIVKARRQMDD